MEDLRPRSLERIVGQTESVRRLRSLANGVRSGAIVPTHLILHGPPGVGKTTAARAFARLVLAEHWENSFHELRSYDDRSVDRLRDGITDLASRPPSRGAPFRIVFLDEADELLPEAQASLRAALEGSTTVFLLACNDLERISRPIRSRCTVLEFSVLKPEEMHRVLRDAVSATASHISDPTLDGIVARSNGVPREAVKLLIESLGESETAGPGEATVA
jgi:replication factor C small subunit